jgi:cytochrome P450
MRPGSLSSAWLLDPYPWLARLRERHPVHRMATGVYVFSRFADVSAILRDPALTVKDGAWFDEHVPGWRDSAGMRLFYSGMVFRHGPDHQRLRKAVSPAFTAARLRHVTGVARRAASRQLDVLAEVAAGGQGDLHGSFTLPVVAAMVCALAGLPDADGGWLYDLVQPLVALLEPQAAAGAAARADQATAQLTPYLAGLLADRRRSPREDLVSAVGALPDDDAISALAFTLAAGFDTTTTLLDTMIIALLASPPQAAAVAEDPAAAEAAMSEALRYDTSVHLITRVARRETAIGGVPLAAGQEVMAMISAAHRDPGQFPDPDTFALDRPPGQPLSFGAGPHYCPGAQLARQVAVLVVPELLRRFPRMTPAGPPSGNGRVVVRGWTSLPVVLTTEDIPRNAKEGNSNVFHLA